MRPLLLSVLMMTATPALANKLCVVDFQKAIGETTEGKAAQSSLDSRTAAKKAEIAKAKATFEKNVKDFQARAVTLSDAEKQRQAQQLMMEEQNLMQAGAQAEAEMQELYYTLLGGLDSKLRQVVQQVGQAQGCVVVFDAAAVAYKQSSVVDVTSALVTKYNATYK